MSDRIFHPARYGKIWKSRIKQAQFWNYTDTVCISVPEVNVLVLANSTDRDEILHHLGPHTFVILSIYQFLFKNCALKYENIKYLPTEEGNERGTKKFMPSKTLIK